MAKMLYYFVNCPSFSHSVANSSMSNAEMFCPSSNTHCHSVARKHDRSLAVIHLFLRGCPSAVRCPMVASAFITVAARIVRVTIYAIYRMILARLRPHVVQKVNEFASPSFAYLYPSSAINFIVVLGFAITSIMHLSPRSVFRRSSPSAAVSTSSSTFVFDDKRQIDRILVSHSFVPLKQVVVRAVRKYQVPPGLFYLSIVAFMTQLCRVSNFGGRYVS
jgi:hypothetical protein